MSHHLVIALPQDPEVLASSTSWTQLEMGVHNTGLCLLMGQGAALAVGIVGRVGGSCGSPPEFLPPTGHRAAYVFLE